MQLRDLSSRISHHPIVRISASCTIKRVPSRKVPGKTWSSYCTILRFFSQYFSSFLPQFGLYQLASICKKTMPNSFGFPSAEDGSPRAGKLSKKLCEVPMMSRVSSGSGTRYSQGLNANVERSRTVRCLKGKEFLSFIQGIHLILYVLNLSQKLIHGRRIFSLSLLTHKQFIKSCLSCSIGSFVTDFS